MRTINKRMAFEVALGFILAGSLVILVRQSRQIAGYRHQQATDAQSLRQLQERLRLMGQPITLPLAPEENPAANNPAGIAKREAIIERLDRDLAQSRATIADLQDKLSAANDQNAQAQQTADARLQKQQTDSQAQLEDLQKKLDAAQSASDIARQRAAVLETDNAQLKSDTSAVSTRAADVARIVSSLQDLERRRDVYLTSILRRYRDITDEFNAIGSMMDSSHESGPTPCGGAALSRIQTAVTSAEDDMRQLSDLSARTQKLDKQLMKK